MRWLVYITIGLGIAASKPYQYEPLYSHALIIAAWPAVIVKVFIDIQADRSTANTIGGDHARD